MNGPVTQPESHHPSEADPPELRAIRGEIDRLDEEIVTLMARRFGYALDTLAVKARHGLLVADVQREAQVVRQAASRARALGLEPELVRDIYWRIIELSREGQRKRAVHEARTGYAAAGAGGTA